MTRKEQIENHYRNREVAHIHIHRVECKMLNILDIEWDAHIETLNVYFDHKERKYVDKNTNRVAFAILDELYKYFSVKVSLTRINLIPTRKQPKRTLVKYLLTWVKKTKKQPTAESLS